MGYVYLITNTINGKRYVGQSQQIDIKRRWNKHKNISKTGLGKVLRDAYEEYGIDNFKFQIICICFNEDCDKYEEEYIIKFNTIVPNGYNITNGGEGGGFQGKTHTEKVKADTTVTSQYFDYHVEYKIGAPLNYFY